MGVARGIWFGGLLGAGLGGILAWYHSERSPELSQEPFAPITSLSASPVEQAPNEAGAVQPAEPGEVAQMPPSEEAGTPPPKPEDLGTELPKAEPQPPAALQLKHLSTAEIPEAELRCARGHASACLEVGQAYAGNEATESRALTYRRQALVLYTAQCQKRDAAACRRLSTLYEQGLGVPRDANNASALMQRYLELCQRDGTGCDEDGDATAEP